MRSPFLLCLSVLVGVLSFGPALNAAETGTEMRSPVNQVFQFSASGVNKRWPDGATSKGTLYLWIPEKCQKVRGLVVLCTNVPEHMLVGHAALREACAANDLGLVWAVPSFWYFGKVAKGLDNLQVDFFQELLNGLAETSGYDEVATVPWLPIGESGHLLMVVGLVDQKPERCIAAICAKNPQYPQNRTVPMIQSLGTAQEWGQTKGDIRTTWNTPTNTYNNLCGTAAGAKWPLTVLVEPGTGHFYCSERMAQFFGHYVDAAAKARLSDDGSTTLKPIDLTTGVLAHLPLPGIEKTTISPFSDAGGNELKRPWFFNENLAKEAQEIAKANWEADTQLPGYVAGDNCTVDPFSFNSVTQVTVTTDAEFSVTGAMLDKIPEPFVGAGSPLATTPGSPVMEWICGPFAPLGNGRFRIALDRSWKGAACYMIARKEATNDVRFSLQPAAVKLVENKEGADQKITFDAIADVSAGTASAPLSTKSSANLPVSFYVESGPAVIEEGKVVFTAIPPRAKYPVAVTVAAWQWGNPKDPKIKTAEIVKQTFHLTK
jgi:hypothetical protein